MAFVEMIEIECHSPKAVLGVRSNGSGVLKLNFFDFTGMLVEGHTTELSAAQVMSLRKNILVKVPTDERTRTIRNNMGVLAHGG
jgi:hypothetical protein